MPPLGPIKRRDLIRYLQELGFDSPTSRGKHQHMKKGDKTLTIPNPHKSEISIGLLSRILQQAGISREEWEEL